MRELIFVTSNSNKLNSARIILQPLGITPRQERIDIHEIQHEDSEVIVRDKAQKAYDIVKKPVVVTDDSWEIPGLKGFPGPYMKSMNEWLTPEDWLRLTLPLTDRTVLLHQHLVFQDENIQKLIKVTIKGTLQTEIKGAAGTEPSACIISLSPDGRTIAEVRADGGSAIANHRSAWHVFADWLQQSKPAEYTRVEKK